MAEVEGDWMSAARTAVGAGMCLVALALSISVAFAQLKPP